MANETTPSAVKSIGPALSTNAQQTTAKVTARAAAKRPAPRSVTRVEKRGKKAQSKQPTSKVAAKKAKSAIATKPKKDSKPKKVKMVRDSYTMPENDYARLAELKKKCLKAGVHVKKSELLRAGLNTLAKLPMATLLKTVEGLVKIKTGRPGKH